jgi:bacteriorhodopsin
MSADQFDLVYNILSLTMASMMASTVFFWLRVSSVNEKYKSAVVISGLVTFIAAYHYYRIFNSWNEAYAFSAPGDIGSGEAGADASAPVLTGKPFNDAYRYMDWLLTVPLLLIEIVFCMKLAPEEIASKATTLGISSGLMILAGYPGELIIEGNLFPRFIFWVIAMVPFGYVVHTLLVGLTGAIAAENDPSVAMMLKNVCWATVISWLTYPFVYLFPFFGLQGPNAVVAIQVGYCVSDIVSKCGVGFLIYNITMAKSTFKSDLTESLLAAGTSGAKK